MCWNGICVSGAFFFFVWFRCKFNFYPPPSGIDDDDIPAEEPSAVPAADEIPPLEGDDDASRMEEVD